MTERPLFSSMHTHTSFCDGDDDVETMCRAAYDKNLFALGFSAHAPVERQIDRENGCELKEILVNQYVAEVLAAKERWKGKLRIFLGYEVDFVKGRRSALDSDITSLNLDYIIGAVHYLYPENGARPFAVDGFTEDFEKGLREGFGGSAEKLMHKYYDALLDMIQTGGFDIVAHADIYKKNCQNKYFWPQETESRRQREAALAVKKAGLAVEVNTGGINRKKTFDVYPSLSFLRIMHEYDIPVIITADAHCAKDLDGNYDIALQTLILADFKEHVLFSGKSCGKSVWIKEKIIKN